MSPAAQHQWARAQCVHGQLRTCSLRLVWFSMACAFPDHNCSSETAGRVGPQSCRNLSIRSTAEQTGHSLPKRVSQCSLSAVFTELAVADQGHRSPGLWALEGKDPRSGGPAGKCGSLGGLGPVTAAHSGRKRRGLTPLPASSEPWKHRGSGARPDHLVPPEAQLRPRNV